jgi:hypothetical protein
MDDLSSAVSFFSLGLEDAGNDGNTSFDFRGPRAFGFELLPLARTGAADVWLSVSAVA